VEPAVSVEDFDADEAAFFPIRGDERLDALGRVAGMLVRPRLSQPFAG
jgi:hypothetical protein